MAINDETFTEWLDKNWTDKTDMCPPPLDPQKALYFLLDYLIGDWYSTMPMSTKQINVEIVNLILRKYSKKYKKEIQERNTTKDLLKRRIIYDKKRSDRNIKRSRRNR